MAQAQVARAIEARTDNELVPADDGRSGVISIDLGRHGGEPCFAGTRVPIQALWDYLEGDESLTAFLDDFPSVSREQAVGLLKLAGEHVLVGLPVR